ncbi:MAG: hypothetical protein GWO24_25160, partial [Akkermansiaceae bacterium]|nr:hypothetical protein [Akkermansiaceae bacterium]
MLYRGCSRDVKTWRWRFLSMLRIAFFALLVSLLLQPVLLLTLERVVPRTLPVLVDATGSMGITDGGGDTRIARVSDSFTVESGQAVLASLDRDLEVPLHSFGAGGLEKFAGDWDKLDPGSDATALGDTLRQALERYRGAALAGVVLVTDGGQNAGHPLAEVGETLKRAGVPVFAVGVGDESARDVAIESVEVSEVLLAEDAAPVTVRLRSLGMMGAGGRVVFSLAGVQVAEETVEFTEDGALEVRSLFTPKRPGEYPLVVRFEAEGVQEALTQNNAARATLRVVDRRLRVLLADQAPRWEYKYLEAMLLRERRVELSCVLFEADREIAQAPGSPYLEQFPFRAEDLFGFDLVILGDVDPRFLTGAHQTLLSDYVSKAGGALVLVAGKRFFPSRYQGTELARLLPVELAGTSISAASEVASRPVNLELTEDGRSSVMLRLGDDAETSEALWSRLPPIYWTARVKRAKPAAEVFLARPGLSGESGTTPVMALHRYGAGEVLFIGTDNFWRWRRNVGDLYHVTLWGQIVQRMAGARLLAESPRVSLRSDRRRYRRGDRVRVFARLFARDWEPRLEGTVTGTVVSGEDPDRRQEVNLRAVPGQPGIYRAEFSAGPPGDYRLALGGEEIASLDFTVRADQRELARAAMNSTLLQDLAGQTGGAF